MRRNQPLQPPRARARARGARRAPRAPEGPTRLTSRKQPAEESWRRLRAARARGSGELAAAQPRARPERAAARSLPPSSTAAEQAAWAGEEHEGAVEEPERRIAAVKEAERHTGARRAKEAAEMACASEARATDLMRLRCGAKSTRKMDGPGIHSDSPSPFTAGLILFAPQQAH